MLLIKKMDTEELLYQLSHDKAIELIPVMVYVCVLMVTGLVGNVLVCIFYGYKTKVTPTTRLIFAVGVLDTLMCISMPKSVVELVMSYKITNSVLCKCHYVFNQSVAVSSGLILLVIGVFRYRLICLPYQKQFTIQHANKAIVAAIVIAIIMAFP